jgi:Flp pilus assembly pilin Flp
MYEFFNQEQGTAAIEYALLISLIGIAVAGSLQALGGNVFDTLSTVDDVLSSVQLQDDPLKKRK